MLFFGCPITSIFHLLSFFLLQFFLSGWDTTSFCTSSSAIGGTIVLDLQSGSCVHCQLFRTYTKQRPCGPAVLRGSPQPAARDNANGSQPWYMPPPAKLGQLACTPREFPALVFFFPEEERPSNLHCGTSYILSLPISH